MVKENVRQLNKLLILTTMIAKFKNWNLENPRQREILKKEVEKIAPVILFPSCQIPEITKSDQLLCIEECKKLHFPYNREECFYMARGVKAFHKRSWFEKATTTLGADLMEKNVEDKNFATLYLVGVLLENADYKFFEDRIKFNERMYTNPLELIWQYGNIDPYEDEELYDFTMDTADTYQYEELAIELSKANENLQSYLEDFDVFVTQHILTKSPVLELIGDEFYVDIFKELCGDISDEKIPVMSELINKADYPKVHHLTKNIQQWAEDYCFVMEKYCTLLFI